MPGPYPSSDPRNYVGIGKEASRTTTTVPNLWIPYSAQVALDHQQSITRIFEAGSAGQVTDSEKISQIPTGTVEFNGRPSTLSKIMAYLLGVDGFSGAGPYTHVLTDDMLTDYLSVEQNLADDMVERFVDAVIAEVTLSCSVDSPKLHAKATWIGGKPSIVSATAESYDAETPFLLTDCAFTVDGSVVTNPRSFEVVVTVAVDAVQIADVVTDYIIKLGLQAKLTITQFALDIATEYRATNYGTSGGTTYTKVPKQGAFIADFNYGAGAAAREAKIEIPVLDYDTPQYTQPDPTGGESVKVTRTAEGRRSGGLMFRFTGKTNDNAAYV